MNTSTEERIQEVLFLQKSALLRLKNSSADERIEKLKKLQKYMLDHQQELFDALFQDFRKPTSEVIIGELLGVKREIDHMVSNIRSWMKPQKVSTPLLLLGTSGHIQYEPKGLCLIIAPWNYPFNLAINPLVHAIAAGNAVILKPSEMSENTSAFIKKMITALYDPSDVFCVEGDAHVSTFLLQQKFDHIFFTGSPAIGKVVMAAAAKHLTSVTLELGGKSPAIIGPDADMASIVRKIAWGKFLNNGQTCIAPDYVYVHEKVHFQFLAGLENTIQAFYNVESNGIEQSKDYARIVNRRHFDRIVRLLDDAKEKGAKVIFGGELNPDTNYISPTILSQCTLDMAIMQEEIFGPLLPVLHYSDFNEVLQYIAHNEKPLSAYLFSNNKTEQTLWTQQLSFGGGCINDAIMHNSDFTL